MVVSTFTLFSPTELCWWRASCFGRWEIWAGQSPTISPTFLFLLSVHSSDVYHSVILLHVLDCVSSLTATKNHSCDILHVSFLDCMSSILTPFLFSFFFLLSFRLLHMSTAIWLLTSQYLMRRRLIRLVSDLVDKGNKVRISGEKSEKNKNMLTKSISVKWRIEKAVCRGFLCIARIKCKVHSDTYTRRWCRQYCTEGVNPLRTQHTWICVKPHTRLLAEINAFPTMQTCLYTVKW